jgi:hypothetical protein
MPASVAMDAGSWMTVVNTNVTKTAPATHLDGHRLTAPQQRIAAQRDHEPHAQPPHAVIGLSQ